jgi:hypothetical protein
LVTLPRPEPRPFAANEIELDCPGSSWMAFFTTASVTSGVAFAIAATTIGAEAGLLEIAVCTASSATASRSASGASATIRATTAGISGSAALVIFFLFFRACVLSKARASDPRSEIATRTAAIDNNLFIFYLLGLCR